MQKYASQEKGAYEIVFTPLPTDSDMALHYDRHSVVLPYAEDFLKQHYHDRYEIGICEEGEGLFLCDGEFASVSKGNLIFVAPHTRHYSRSLHADALCQCRFIYVPQQAVQAILECLGMAKNKKNPEHFYAIPTVIRAEEYPAAANLLSEIVAYCKDTASCRDRSVILRLCTFLVECEHWFEKERKTTSDKDIHTNFPEAAKVAEYLSMHYDEAIGIGELAKMCHLSESQLRRQFLNAYGMPPHAYRNYLRCNIAIDLLSHTALSITDISEKLGYTLPSDFYRRFRNTFGMSPSEYRKRK